MSSPIPVQFLKTTNLLPSLVNSYSEHVRQADSGVISHFPSNFLVYYFCDLSTFKSWNKRHIKIPCFFLWIPNSVCYRRAVFCLSISSYKHLYDFPTRFFATLNNNPLNIHEQVVLVHVLTSPKVCLGIEFWGHIISCLTFLATTKLFSQWPHHFQSLSISLIMCYVCLFFLVSLPVGQRSCCGLVIFSKSWLW